MSIFYNPLHNSSQTGRWRGHSGFHIALTTQSCHPFTDQFTWFWNEDYHHLAIGAVICKLPQKRFSRDPSCLLKGFPITALPAPKAMLPQCIDHVHTASRPIKAQGRVLGVLKTFLMLNLRQSAKKTIGVLLLALPSVDGTGNMKAPFDRKSLSHSSRNP